MMMRTRPFLWCGVALFALAGCVDLAEPNIPSLGAPAIFNVTVRDIPGLPLNASGTLNPGREVSGVRRRVLSPLIVVHTPVTLPEPNAQGTIVISAAPPRPAPGFVGPYEVQPPIIDGLPAPSPFRWFGVRRLDPDTVYTDALGDVALHVESDLGDVQPAGRARQWFLELRGDFTSIRVSGDGDVPPTLRIPSQFIPPAPDKHVDVTLIYFQSAGVSSAGYIANVTLDVRVLWVVRLP